MRKYKINRKGNIKLPPPEVIEQHKDFRGLRAQYKEITQPSKPLYKNRKLFLLLLLIGLIAWLIAESMQEERNQEKKIEHTQEVKKK